MPYTKPCPGADESNPPSHIPRMKDCLVLSFLLLRSPM